MYGTKSKAPILSEYWKLIMHMTLSIFIYIYGRFHWWCTGHSQGLFHFVATRKVTDNFKINLWKLWTTIKIDNVICIINFQYSLSIGALDFVPYIIFFSCFFIFSRFVLKYLRKYNFMDNMIVLGWILFSPFKKTLDK